MAYVTSDGFMPRFGSFAIEYHPAHHYIGPMVRRLLIVLLVAWIGIAPAIANSCAADCQMSGAAMHGGDISQPHSDVSGSPDCHGQNDHQDTKVPDGGAMVTACFVAAASAIPAISFALLKVDIASVQHAFVLLPPLTFETSAPIKPPQA